MTCPLLLISLLSPLCPPPEASPLAAVLGSAEAAVELELKGGYESLTGGMADWNDVFARLQAPLSSRIDLYAEATRAERFDLVDSQILLGGSVRAGGAWDVEAGVSASPAARFLPSFAVQANLHRDVGGGVVLGLGGRHAAYDIGNVRIGTARADLYTGNRRLGYALMVGSVGGGLAATHIASLSRYYGELNGLNLILAAGRSIERVTPRELIETDIRAVAIWGTHWSSPRSALTYGASLHRQDDTYDRRRVELGLKFRL